MQLVFIHGWGFDAHFWNRLAPLLNEFPQKHIDLGFFGNASNNLDDKEPSILVGHSLGYAHGMANRKNWQAAVAINSFPNFIIENATGCVTAATLRAMRKQLAKEPEYTLATFYKLINATPPVTASPDIERLQTGLDELRDRRIEHTSTIPTLVLAAKNDPLVPPTTSEALPGTFHWHPSGGHMLPLTATDWCANAIKNFIQQACT